MLQHSSLLTGEDRQNAAVLISSHLASLQPAVLWWGYSDLNREALTALDFESSVFTNFTIPP